eukprot:scaffold3.g6444.t1
MCRLAIETTVECQVELGVGRRRRRPGMGGKLKLSSDRCTPSLHSRSCSITSAALSDGVLFLSPVWPERSSSAAGVRSWELAAAFQRWGYRVAYSAAAAPNAHTVALEVCGMRTHSVPPNRAAALGATLAAARPGVVVFDRFYAEEFYSSRVRELAPDALRVLDMQDMHSLRGAREAAVRAGAPAAAVLACRPGAGDPDLLRELTAIHRSDLTLVCSPVELRLLRDHYGVPAHKLALAPLFYAPSPHDTAGVARSSAVSGAGQPAAQPRSAAACPGFSERRDVMMVGNFLHKPNLDGVRQACALWPAARAALRAAQAEGRLPPGPLPELHIFGAYPPGSAAQQFDRPAQGVRLLGWAPSLDVMLSHRLLLAPLRFGAGERAAQWRMGRGLAERRQRRLGRGRRPPGRVTPPPPRTRMVAGLKGKVADSWWHGLPVVTSPLGAEGMEAEEEAALAAPPSSAAADPALDGYIWQEGGFARSTSGDDSGAAGCGGTTDAAAQGPVWQEGPAGSSGKAAVADWGGLRGSDSPEDLAADVARLYCDEALWGRCQAAGFRLLRRLYDGEATLGAVRAAVEGAAAAREARRDADFVGGLLWQQQLRASEFMSKYIELKESMKAA